MSTTANYRRWIGRIESGEITQPQARQWCNTVARLCAGREMRGHRTVLETKEAHALWDRMHAHPVKLHPDDEQRGMRWLKAHGAKRLGIPADVIALFDHFTFRGDAEITGMNAYPIWRVHLTDGREFDYYCPPWQATAYAYGASRTSAASLGAVWWWADDPCPDDPDGQHHIGCECPS